MATRSCVILCIMTRRLSMRFCSRGRQFRGFSSSAPVIVCDNSIHILIFVCINVGKNRIDVLLL